MSVDEEDDESISSDLDQRYLELCLSVNMDKPTMEKALQEFQIIRKNYTLEGDELHWLVCALYVKSRGTVVPTVSGVESKGNYISINKLLQHSNLSFICFLRKMEKWLEMNQNAIPKEFTGRIKSLERSFCVCTPIFKKFCPLFQTVFTDPFDPVYTPSKHKRRHRKVQCTSSDIFKFCWTLFIHAKATQYRAITEDLVSSFQLLLSVINLCFTSALGCTHREKLLNPEFPGLPKNWRESDFTPPVTIDIINLLVESRAAAGLTQTQANKFSLEARVVNRHQFATYIRSLLSPEENVLSGSENMCDLFWPQNFDQNRKAIDKCYEEYILTEGDFDERIFLCDNVEEALGTPIKQRPIEKHGGDPTNKKSSGQLKDDCQHENTSMFQSRTPLTNRLLLSGRDNGKVTPISLAVHSLSKLQTLLQGQELYFSKAFASDFINDSTEILDVINSRLDKLGEKFLSSYCSPYKDHPGGTREFGETRLMMIKKMYFKSVETIIWQEKKRIEGKSNVLITRDDFHTLLFACCIEVVLCSYQSIRVFPWVLESLEIKPYYFYKVIELVIRAEEGLSRDVVKHLNHIEEQVLESWAWTDDSPVWEAIETAGSVPSCEEVNYPHHVSASKLPATSKVPHPRVRAVADLMPTHVKSESVTALPAAMAHDRFSSPLPGSVKRCLFQTNVTKETAATHTEAADSSVESQGAEMQKPKRTGSLALFFRKVYHMASIRLKDLCDKLSMPANMQGKVWTCFERSLVSCAFQLMRNRHMDQLIMCAVYVIAKVTQQDQSFQEIMRCYRSQPQASSHVYRSVLISSGEDPGNEERDDLIQFYNKVYVPNMKDYVKRFSMSSANATNETLPLSPMPTSRCVVKSPRKVIGSYQLYVSPHKLSHDENLSSTSPALEYSFQRSPSTNLREFNEMMVRQKPIQRKRILDFSQENDVARRGNALQSKLRKVQEDRTNLN